MSSPSEPRPPLPSTGDEYLDRLITSGLVIKGRRGRSIVDARAYHLRTVAVCAGQLLCQRDEAIAKLRAEIEALTAAKGGGSDVVAALKEAAEANKNAEEAEALAEKAEERAENVDALLFDVGTFVERMLRFLGPEDACAESIEEYQLRRDAEDILRLEVPDPADVSET
jgi:hypothetical protein